MVSLLAILQITAVLMVGGGRRSRKSQKVLEIIFLNIFHFNSSKLSCGYNHLFLNVLYSRLINRNRKLGVRATVATVFAKDS